MAHTPGPWRHFRSGVIETERPYGERRIAKCYDDDKDIDLLLANARLIAAAPDMLEVLESTWGKGGTVGGHLPACIALTRQHPYPLSDYRCDCGCDAAWAAIAKARGE